MYFEHYAELEIVRYQKIEGFPCEEVQVQLGAFWISRENFDDLKRKIYSLVVNNSKFPPKRDFQVLV